MIIHMFHAPDEFGDEFVRAKQHLGLRTNMVVHQLRIGLADNFDEMIKGHAVVETHCFHGHRHILNLQNLVVVGGYQPVERITNKAETEVARTQSSGLLRSDQGAQILRSLLQKGLGLVCLEIQKGQRFSVEGRRQHDVRQ